jgi:hypothetical protein
VDVLASASEAFSSLCPQTSGQHPPLTKTQSRPMSRGAAEHCSSCTTTVIAFIQTSPGPVLKHIIDEPLQYSSCFALLIFPLLCMRLAGNVGGVGWETALLAFHLLLTLLFSWMYVLCCAFTDWLERKWNLPFTSNWVMTLGRKRFVYQTMVASWPMFSYSTYMCNIIMTYLSTELGNAM